MAEEGDVLLDLIGRQTMEARQLSRDSLQANQDLIRRSEQTASKLSSIYDQIADASYLKSLTEGLGALNAQKAAQVRAHDAGVNPGDTTDALSTTLREANDAENRTYGLMKEWEKNQSTSILDSPIEWVKARFTEDTLKTHLTQTAAQADFLNKRVQNLNTRVQQGAITENAIKTTMSAVSIEAQANILSGEAKIASEKAALEAFAANARGVDAALKSTTEQLRFAYDYKSAVNQEKNIELALANLGLSKGHLAISQGNFELSKENAAFNRDIKNDAKAAKEEGKELDAWYLERYNLGRAAAGLEPIPEGANQKAILNMVKGGANPEANLYFHLGELTAAAKVPMIGATPAAALRTLEALPTNLPPGREGAMSILFKAREAAAANPTLDAKKSPDQYNAFVNKWVKDELIRTSAAITRDSPRYIGDLKSYLGSLNPDGTVTPGISSLTALPITQKVFAPLIKAGQPLDDPTMIRSLGAKAVLEGVITSSEYSSGLSAIFQKANEISIQSNHYTGMGMTLPQAGKNYFVPGGMFQKPIDMTSATALGQELAKDLSSRVNSQSERAKSKFGAPAKPYVAGEPR